MTLRKGPENRPRGPSSVKLPQKNVHDSKNYCIIVLSISERRTKHLKELIKLKKEGFRTVVFFLVQHPLGEFFRPNWENDSLFSKTLNEAYENGVEILVYKCDNSLNGIKLIPEPLGFDLSEF